MKKLFLVILVTVFAVASSSTLWAQATAPAGASLEILNKSRNGNEGKIRVLVSGVFQTEQEYRGFVKAQLDQQLPGFMKKPGSSPTAFKSGKCEARKITPDGPCLNNVIEFDVVQLPGTGRPPNGSAVNGRPGGPPNGHPVNGRPSPGPGPQSKW